MKEIIIIPHIGIGQLKLGMAPDELEKTLLQMKRQWSNSSNEAMQMERCAETDIEYLVLVIIGYKCHPCSGLLVTAQIGHAVNVRDLPFLYNLICG